MKWLGGLATTAVQCTPTRSSVVHVVGKICSKTYHGIEEVRVKLAASSFGTSFFQSLNPEVGLPKACEA
jgi:hypothetical protein